ncbi:MAG: undecaprenyldiphospho-muramoylpentapeptide beta-N-acetylglucosaminyltransferase [Bacteroidales bacterium]|nr:undecaprenyldiphospho-muramoylpentapeptide beta-N-acetylglucosaminyltransferase [Bacteroidales bacterium]
MRKNKKIIISGGGTGGHIFPAISIANALKRIDKNIEILFVGAKSKMEMQRVPDAGYKIVGLPISGFQRRITFKNITFFFKLLISILKSKRIINSFKPDIAVGVGGYASGPLLYVASKKRIPTLIQEQNSYAGVTNKLLAKRVNKICVAYQNMDKFFPKQKILFTGNPIRKDLLDINNKKDEAYKYFNLNNKSKVVLIIGGSLGALTINQSVSQDLDRYFRSGVQLIWQTGKNFFEKAKFELLRYDNKDKKIKIYDFITKMDYAYAVADVIISRAGAGTISELCLVKKPVILIPSPNVAEDHQTKNAIALADKNAAVLIKDNQAKEMLADKALSLINDTEKMNNLSENISKLAVINSDEIIANEILKMID